VGSDHSLEYLKQVFDVNLHGQWVMAKVVSPHLVKQRWGRIVNVASIAAYLHQLSSAGGDPDHFELSNYAYMQSKWGVLGLTRHMAGQLGQYNVTVNCIAPGLTNTAATEKQVPTDFQPMFATMSAMRRNTEPEHMVGPAVFFASADADMVNGQVLVVDGGNVMVV
jgi:3-oxoacyl-[acyl-carrier protein] reductase